MHTVARCAFAALFVAVPLSAQLQETVHVTSYATQAAAGSALPGYLTTDWAALIPMRVDSPFFGSQRAVYAIAFQPLLGEDEACNPGVGTSAPPTTFITGVCSHVLTTWTVRTFNTLVGQRSYYSTTLSALQRGTAYVLTSPATVASPYLVVYQIEATSGPCQ